MRFSFLAFVLVGLLLAPQGRATPQDDAAFIVRELVAVNHRGLRETMASQWSGVYAERLGERSVWLLDRDRFAQGVPLTIVAPWVERLEQAMINKCFSDYSAQALHNLAETFRQDPDRSWAKNSGDRPVSMEEFREDVKALGENTPVRASLVFLFCGLPLTAQMKREMRVEVKTLADGHSGEIADILAEPGIAAFPNRIIKQNILSEIRNAGR